MRRHVVIFSAFLLAWSAAARGDIKTRLAAAGDAAKYNADAVIVLDETDVTVQPNGIGVSRMCRLVKVLREAAIRSEAVQRFNFDPTTNTLELKVVRVHRADGRVDQVPLESAVVQPESQWGIYWGSHEMLVDVPRLEVGDAVETEVVKTGFNVAYLEERSDEGAGTSANPQSAIRNPEPLEPPMPGHWYDEVSFVSSLPIIEKRYVVRMPKDKPLQYEVYNGEVRSSVVFDGEHVVHTFEKRDIAPFQGEPHMVSTRDVGCKLVLATLPDWKAKSRWFHQANEPSFKINDEVKQTVQRVTSECRNAEEKITALNHWVAESIRYVGTSRGPCEGYTTHPAQETFDDRGGVCKDKAGLLVAMLREAGFDSHIVMTQAGTDVAPVPADQFNHAVTCIRRADGSFRLLDPTWMPKSRENWSSAEQLQYVVYGTPEGQDLTTSPYSGPEENCVAWNAESEINEDGTLTGKLRITTVGAPETALRRAMARMPESQRVNILDEAFMRLSPAAFISNPYLMDPVDFSEPMTLSCGFEAERYLLGDGERRYTALPVLRAVLADTLISDTLGVASAESRKFPLRLRSTRRMQFAEKIRLPRNWSASELPEKRRIDGGAAAIDFQISESPGMLEYRCDVDLKKHRVAPGDYAQFKQVLDCLAELSRKLITLRESTAQASS